MVCHQTPWEEKSCGAQETDAGDGEAAALDGVHPGIEAVVPVCTSRDAQRGVDVDVRGDDVVRQIRAIEFQSSKREEEGEEVSVVASTDAIVDPGAVMIAHRDALPAERTVF